MKGLERLERGKHFLVIENDPDDAFLIRRAFTTIPHCTSFVCRNTSEAKAYVLGAGLYSRRDTYPLPDTILCDLRLGDESGVQFIEWLFKTDEVKKFPVVVLTGSASPKEMEAAEGLGAKKVLRKPNDVDALRRMLAQIAQDLCKEDAPAGKRE